ncbi:hypothetical protein AB8615_12275 [Litorimonas sp. RW-G-Af-16]|uniref:hypothetical protein n=1 Tax=Litorimonas sp. RW-G-Af-16 TaxID=3241168 RepID=UPI003AAABD96
MTQKTFTDLMWAGSNDVKMTLMMSLACLALSTTMACAQMKDCAMKMPLETSQAVSEWYAVNDGVMGGNPLAVRNLIRGIWSLMA